MDLSKFHSDDYVDCLKNITLEHKDRYADQIRAYGFTDSTGDCPVFDYMYEYCQRYTAGTLLAGAKLA